ncbi:MAG: CDP-diacylglycerol--glycerol-3-phosphate 3-phosphatidyltransferase [Pseudomonadota bacterium]
MSQADEFSRADALNLPNILTLGRIAAVPVIALALLLLDAPAGPLIAFVLFVAASLTDWLDGYLARAWDQQSDLGRMLDPIADKLLVGIVLAALLASGGISGVAIVPALAILAREIFISGLREFVAGRTITLHVTALAKSKTAVQMIGLGLLLIAPVIGTVAGVAIVDLGALLLWIAAALTVWTGFDYLRAAWPHING